MNEPEAIRIRNLACALLCNDPKAPNASNTSFIVEIEHAGDSSAILIRNDVDQYQERFTTAGEVAEYLTNHCWIRPVGCFHRVDQQVWERGDDRDYLCVHCERKLLQRVFPTSVNTTVTTAIQIHKADAIDTKEPGKGRLSP